MTKIKNALDAAFKRIAAEFERDGVTVLMPTYSPPQGRLLSEFNRVGGRACIVGGQKNVSAFDNVPQYGLGFDTTPYINSFPPGMSARIVNTTPAALIQDKKVALFSFITPPASWAQHIADRDLNTEIVASNEQNTRLFFENKGNLMHILEAAGLGAYVIPTEVVDANMSEQALRAVYDRVKNEQGKVVVQSCIENYEPTRFMDCAEDFVAGVKDTKVPFKVTRFVVGNEANLSFAVANTLPSRTGRGVQKCNLPADIDPQDPESLAAIEAHAAAQGIDASNVFSVTGRATLKVVGDKLLASEPGDGVGNNIGHVYAPAIRQQITEIGDKLGQKMGCCGKVGLAGADLIIDASGKIWINEINDRQQGPTDQMSADAEAADLPGLSRMIWFAHYADFTQAENLNLLAALRDQAEDIHQGYLTSPGSFYIKAYATHAEAYDGKTPVLQHLPAGLYTVRLEESGRWSWSPAAADTVLEPVDLASGSITVNISSGGLQKGDCPMAGAEMFRVTGIASGADAPFLVEAGASYLSPIWREMLEQLYTDCLGEDYIEKNPQYRAPTPQAPPAPKDVASPRRQPSKGTQPG